MRTAAYVGPALKKHQPATANHAETCSKNSGESRGRFKRRLSIGTVNWARVIGLSRVWFLSSMFLRTKMADSRGSARCRGAVLPVVWLPFRGPIGNLLARPL